VRRFTPHSKKILKNFDNGGGGIFRTAGHKETCFNTFFETSHCLTAEHLANVWI
jgi:2-succinyl-5-enolpyruvyl-6-hydroxy-3-cyclohexene-1-carboxylate synthase